MDFTIPVYIETATLPGQPADYVVRPLFFESPVTRSPILQAALSKLTHRVREMLVELGKVQRHDGLAGWTFHPEMETRRCEVRVEVAKRFARLKLLLVMMRKFGRTIAFTPAFPDLWFEILTDQHPEDRLTEAVTEHLRKVAKEGGEEQLDSLERYSLKGNAWVSEIEFRINPPRVREKKQDSLFAFLGSNEAMDGESELYRVGRCLNHQYPHDLDRVLLRDTQVEELSRLLKSDDRRPVLLLGQRQCGKTAILHEYVFQHVRAVGNPHRDKQAVWLLSPQRLISGMSYVGQWETRFHAIIRHAGKRDLTLYFDDMLGLFQAGVTSQSCLSVASLLKTTLERREVRVVGEMTPEIFRVFREQDRAFADMFHVIRVEELTGDANLKVLFGLQRQIELRHKVRFAIDALPAIVDLQRRYARDVAFPGKAAGFMKRLAVKAEGESETPLPSRGKRTTEAHSGAARTVSRERVLEAFHQQSGLPRSFLDQQQTLQTDEIASRLRERFVGQPEGIRAAVEILSIARARMNDPSRPIASLLLLGPTGVGKTEFAKSLASYLFGNSDRLLRFDMNEYVSPNAVPQLVGTFAQPEGLLTAAVRRQPFGVLLFDEIEKGHPDVFDLLLQVLGEGRLTDARGRTTDFTNTIIVLTSNLGTQRAETGLGFGTSSSHGASISIRAAESFFRPEFFNRLDRVIPFERLSRDDMQGIARHLMADVLQRDGLVRRQCVLNATPAAVDWVIDQGYNPVLGARALKRAIEKELTRPIAAFLAEQGSSAQPRQNQAASSGRSSAADGVTLIDIDRVEQVDRQGRLANAEPRLSVAIRTLALQTEPAPRRTESDDDVVIVLQQCEQALKTVNQRLPNLKATGIFETGRLSPSQTRYLLVQDEARRLQQWYEEILSELNANRRSFKGAAVSHPGRSMKGTIRRRGPSHGSLVGRDAADDEIDDFVQTGFESGTRDVDLHDEPLSLLARCHWVKHVAFAEPSQMEEAVTLRVVSLDLAGLRFMEAYLQRLCEAWTDELGLETEVRVDSNDARVKIVTIKGILARHYAQSECGFHATRLSESATPSLFSVHDFNDSVPDIVIRQLSFDVSARTLRSPTIDELRRSVWESLNPEP